jgi:7-carboxy-7-deazaguanine synthase
MAAISCMLQHVFPDDGRLSLATMAADTLRINEIFYSIQGESTWAGCPCVFVRLSGCHLRCTYCDTEYAFKQGSTRTIPEILEEVSTHGCQLVEITGGEPLLQSRVHQLIKALCDRDKTVLIETSGACDISVCDERAIRILDIKTPGSGESDRNLWSNLDHLSMRDEVKFVITDHADYRWAKEIIEKHQLTQRCHAVLLSPVFEQPAGFELPGHEGLPMYELVQWMLHEPIAGGAVRLQTQLHKHIWDPQTRGV